MSDNAGAPPNRTVFRPSPLQESKSARDSGPDPQGAAPFAFAPQTDAFPAAPAAQQRNPLVEEAQSLLALLAAFRAGRLEIDLPRLHGVVSGRIADYERALGGRYDKETVQRAIYALCATADDVAKNRPGNPGDAAEWARRSMEVRFVGEHFGGDRFWSRLDRMLTRPGESQDMLELYHACMACGFEGRYRLLPDGQLQHQAMMQRVFQALAYPRELSPTELSPHWRGVLTEMPSVKYWAPLTLAASAAAVALTLAFLIFRLGLGNAGLPAYTALAAIVPDGALHRAHPVAPPPLAPRSTQYQRICQSLQDEINRRLVVVTQGATTIRIRTKIGGLFDSNSADINPAYLGLYGHISDALRPWHGHVWVEGYTDSAHISSGAFPDNPSLSRARADRVADLLRQALGSDERVTARGLGEAKPVAPNTSPAGMALNRRVEIAIENEAP